MNSTIFLPKTIKVGYQSREDTYTGQLAYVIYYDQKGKLRKETSWNSWRDNKIEPQEFPNEPTSGFVLNKKVGDYSSYWNHRQAYCRVYDPRNFEFEITIENLLYILENASSIKGKGLEGDFVYGWDGKDLLLMPVDSPDYKEITQYSEMILRNSYVKAKDLKLGAVYKTKDNEEWIYMGRFDYHTTKYERVEIPQQNTSWYGYRSYDSIKVNVNKGKHHFFARKTEDYLKNPYLSVLTIKSLGEKFVDTISTECVENYAELFDKLECKTEYSPYDTSKDEYVRYTLEEFNDSINKTRWKDYYDNVKNKYEVYLGRDDIYYCKKKDKYNSYDGKAVQGTLEEIYQTLQPMYKNEYLENGKLYKEGK